MLLGLEEFEEKFKHWSAEEGGAEWIKSLKESFKNENPGFQSNIGQSYREEEMIFGMNGNH